MILAVAALVWGFAEATLFIVVPDVLLTFIVMVRGLRRAVVCALWATLGAVLGGALLFIWAGIDPGAARGLIEALPTVSPETINRALAAFHDYVLGALIVAGLTGLPYKVMAVLAPQLGFGLVPFLMVSAGARFARFLLVVLLAAGLDRVLGRWFGRRLRLIVLAGAWLLFYGWFWSA